jgi:hypothetical protein
MRASVLFFAVAKANECKDNEPRFALGARDQQGAIHAGSFPNSFFFDMSTLHTTPPARADEHKKHRTITLSRRESE